MLSNLHPASFRDPDGAVISHEGGIYRVVSNSYKDHYDTLMSSGLYQELADAKMLVKHTETEISKMTDGAGNTVYKTLRPEMIPFISYPYEWGFSQLKKAALLTLDIQLKALEKNMSLKDATAYNIQFKGKEAIFIDTTSFEKYAENTPWQAYGQFCRHFLGPLLLWHYGKRELTKLSLSFMDGIPLNIISYSLPRSTRFNFFIFSHIHYHAKLEGRYNRDISVKQKKLQINKTRLLALLLHLKNGIENLKLKKEETEWTGYYNNFSYNKGNFNQKQNAVLKFIDSVKPSRLLDLGCNEGEFSILCSERVKEIIAVDFDQMVIERFYKKLEGSEINNILPLVVDFSNPTPAIGLNNLERSSFADRGKFDAMMALALIHHLSIGNNIPFPLIAKRFSEMAGNLIIEFVPKEDVQAQRLLVTKKDVFTNYNLENFKAAFSEFFEINDEHKLEESGRILFLMKKHA